MSSLNLNEETPSEITIEQNTTKDRLVLFGSFVFMYFYQIVMYAQPLRRGLVASLAYGIGAMLMEGLVLLILYFIARAITKKTGKWHFLYVGLIVAYLVFSPILQWYGRGGSIS